MIGRGKIIVFGTFLVSLFAAIAFAGGTPESEPIVTRTVTFVDGENQESRQVELGGNVTDVPNVTPATGSTFEGWYDAAGNRISDFSNILSDITVYARYTDGALANDPENPADPANPDNPNAPNNPNDPAAPGEEGEETYTRFEPWYREGVSWVPEAEIGRFEFGYLPDGIGLLSLDKVLSGLEVSENHEGVWFGFTILGKDLYLNDVLVELEFYPFTNDKMVRIISSNVDSIELEYYSLANGNGIPFPYGTYSINESNHTDYKLVGFDLIEGKVASKPQSDESDAFYFGLTDIDSVAKIIVTNKGTDISVDKEYTTDTNHPVLEGEYIVYVDELIHYTITVSNLCPLTDDDCDNNLLSNLVNPVISDILTNSLLDGTIVVNKESKNGIKTLLVEGVDYTVDENTGNTLVIRVSAIIEPLEKIIVTYDARVSTSAHQGQSADNFVTVTSDNAKEVSVGTSTPIEETAELVLTKTNTPAKLLPTGAKNYLYPLTSIAYKVTVTNNSGVDAKLLTITDKLGEFLKYDSSCEVVVTLTHGRRTTRISPEININSDENIMEINLRRLSDGSKLTINYCAKIDENVPQKDGENDYLVRNDVYLKGFNLVNIEDEDYYDTKFTENYVDRDVRVTIEKNTYDSKSSYKVGETLTYKITIQNQDDYEARGVILSDIIQSGLRLQKVTLSPNDQTDINEDLTGNNVYVSVPNIPPRSSVDYYVTVTIDDDIQDGDRIENIACVDGVNFINRVSVCNDKTIIVDNDPLLEITKENTPLFNSPVYPGDPIIYTITVSRVESDGIIGSATVIDKLSSKLTFDIEAFKVAYPNVEVEETSRGYEFILDNDMIAELNKDNGEVTLVLNVIVKNGVRDLEIISNEASVIYSNKNANDDDKEAISKKVYNRVALPNIQIVKTHDKNSHKSVDVNDEIGYIITVLNLGTGTAYGVEGKNKIIVTDTIPTYLDFVSYPEDCDVDGQRLTCELDAIPGLSIRTISFKTIVNDNAVHGEDIINTASVDYKNPKGGNSHRTSNRVINRIDIPTPDGDKEADKTEVLPGENITYTITVNNTSKGIIKNVKVFDEISEDVEIILSTVKIDGVLAEFVNYNTETRMLEVTIPEIIDSVKVTFEVTVKDVEGPVVNEACITSCDVFKTEEVTTEIVKPELDVHKYGVESDGNEYQTTEPLTIKNGETITYKITVKNTGDGVAKNVVITDSIDPMLTVDESTILVESENSENNGKLFIKSGSTYTWNFNLEADEVVTITFTATVVNEGHGLISNTAEYNYGFGSGNTETIEHKVIGTADVVINKKLYETVERKDEDTITTPLKAEDVIWNNGNGCINKMNFMGVEFKISNCKNSLIDFEAHIKQSIDKTQIDFTETIEKQTNGSTAQIYYIRVAIYDNVSKEWKVYKGEIPVPHHAGAGVDVDFVESTEFYHIYQYSIEENTESARPFYIRLFSKDGSYSEIQKVYAGGFTTFIEVPVGEYYFEEVRSHVYMGTDDKYHISRHGAGRFNYDVDLDKIDPVNGFGELLVKELSDGSVEVEFITGGYKDNTEGIVRNKTNSSIIPDEIETLYGFKDRFEEYGPIEIRVRLEEAK